MTFHLALEGVSVRINELIHIFGQGCLCSCLWVGTGQLFFSIVGVATKTAVAPASDHRSPNSKQSWDWAQIAVLVSATAHFLAIWHRLHIFEVCKDLLECLSYSVTPFVFANKITLNCYILKKIELCLLSHGDDKYQGKDKTKIN